MTYPKAILLSSIILAAAFVFASFSPLASQSSGGNYMIAGNSGQFVWRVDQASGSISYCVRRDNSIDPDLLKRRPPYCSSGSPALR
ncbi:MAG: hypothetical protein CMP22_02625 [Rickettsiales bacterium]|nr:hypothetical protein [Rickettsiales bacterium]|tara:strand:+ start:50 stop:307 length:258 start_codon:yes stop_codon:yes gene_type:complete